MRQQSNLVFINKFKLLLHYYSKVGLKGNQVLVIMLVMVFSSPSKKFVSPSFIASRSSFSTKEVETIIYNLENHYHLAFTNYHQGKLQLKFDPLFKKLNEIYNEEVLLESSDSYKTLKTSLPHLTRWQTMSLFKQVRDENQIRLFLQAIHNLELPPTHRECQAIVVNLEVLHHERLTQFN